jgi:hypothetical protein
MKFKVCRTSIKHSFKSPCEEAFSSDMEWFVDFKNLKDLVKFSNKHGDIIVSGNVIEIYDDFREPERQYVQLNGVTYERKQ